MDEERLSPSQRAYLFDRERFLQGLDERAEGLFADGYTVSETNRAYLFAVTAPTRQGEKVYFVNALDRTCTCPFLTRQTDGETLTDDGTLLPCKHLRGLRKLIRLTRKAHFDNGATGCGYRLWVHWLATLSEQAHREGRRPVRENIAWPDGTRIAVATGLPAPHTLEARLPATSERRPDHEPAGSA